VVWANAPVAINDAAANAGMSFFMIELHFTVRLVISRRAELGSRHWRNGGAWESFLAAFQRPRLCVPETDAGPHFERSEKFAAALSGLQSLIIVDCWRSGKRRRASIVHAPGT
jgi:hypothetical protein